MAFDWHGAHGNSDITKEMEWRPLKFMDDGFPDTMTIEEARRLYRQMPSATISSVLIIFNVLAWVAFIIRALALCRRRKGFSYKNIWASDYMLLFAFLAGTSSNAGGLWFLFIRDHYEQSLQPGVTRLVVPILGVPRDVAGKVLKVATGHGLFGYYTTIWTVKATFCLFYYESSPNMTKNMRYFLHFIAVSVLATYLACIALNFTHCVPIWTMWTFDDGFCLPNDSLPITVAAAWSNILTDLILMLYAHFTFRKLNLNSSQRWGFYFIMAVGIATISTSTTRFVYVVVLFMKKDPTVSYLYFQKSFLASGMELNIAMMAACLPGLRIFYYEYIEDYIKKPVPTSGNMKITNKGYMRRMNQWAERNKVTEDLPYRRPTTPVRVLTRTYTEPEELFGPMPSRAGTPDSDEVLTSPEEHVKTSLQQFFETERAVRAAKQRVPGPQTAKKRSE